MNNSKIPNIPQEVSEIALSENLLENIKEINPDSTGTIKTSDGPLSFTAHLSSEETIPKALREAAVTEYSGGDTSSNKSPLSSAKSLSPAKHDRDQTSDSSTSVGSLKSISTESSSLSKSALYEKLTTEQKNALDRGEIVMTERETDPNSLTPNFIRDRGMFATKLGPTFQAYKIVNADCTTVADKLFLPGNAGAFMPVKSFDFKDKSIRCAEDGNSYSATYVLKDKISGLNFHDEIPLEVKKEFGTNGEVTVSFDQPEKSEYFRKIRGSLTAEPHEGKALARFEVFVDSRGRVIPRLLEASTSGIKAGIQEVFQGILTA
ncbi:MAG: hypothetical protein ACOYK6_04245 [Chthoniobacterales bacterium]